MRLDKIKLAGFKSFVDPTTVILPRNLTGIVGPNGCGKSNVIDAVRWVMGESSAKTLRGEAMADVIFNGSTTRKPVGQAIIELVFDNSDGRAGGQFAQYNQIAVRRQLTRDGQSAYFLNNARCRRRDVMDLFLGTGLGPRSYSIIEQGMISRFIEARPEELRMFIEEAAGVSKYKERRRETELRIRHTRENLDRISDLREEVGKQLKHLQRQAKTAQRYQDLKGRERHLKAELMALHWRILERECNLRSQRMLEQETQVQKMVADQRRVEAEIERLRVSHQESVDLFGQVQERSYAVGGEITRLEQLIQHQKDLIRQRQLDLEQIDKELREAWHNLKEDEAHSQRLDKALREQEPQLETARTKEQEAAASLSEAEEALRQWHAAWEEFNHRVSRPSETAQVERARIRQLENQGQQLQARLQRVQQEQSQLERQGLDTDIAHLERAEQAEHLARTELEDRLQSIQREIRGRREALKEVEQALAYRQQQAQECRGRCASLHALQEAALGKNENEVSDWLVHQGLHGVPRLIEGLEVEEGWEQAVETVLGFHIEAYCVPDLERNGRAARALESGVSLFQPRSVPVSSNRALDSRLTSKVTLSDDQAHRPLSSLLGHVRAVSDLDTAWAMRAQLADHESVISPEAVWIGPDWMRVNPRAGNGDGVLRRERELRELGDLLDQVDEEVEQLRECMEAYSLELHNQEEERETLQQELHRTGHRLGERKSELSALRTRHQQVEQRREQLQDEHRELTAQLEDERQQLLEAHDRLQEALASMESLAQERETLAARRDELSGQIEQVRAESRAERNRAHELALQVERLRSTLTSMHTTQERLRQQVEQLELRRQQLRDSLQGAEEPIATLSEKLEKQLVYRLEVDAELAAARQAMEQMSERLRQVERERSQVETSLEAVRRVLEDLRVEQQETLTKRQAVADQLEQSGSDRQILLQNLGEEAEIPDWEVQLSRVSEQIQRLGPINLAAIDEFAAQSQRMDYLSAQYSDLSDSLATLERAIQKIDRETRARMKDTFERVNHGFQSMFPKLFGGGQAALELTGGDLLEAGIAVTARPPGKRNSSIHLLSGGEKALTAVALVFAIFELNPAPFCMLDEVDAPLDDANVGRFCEMVKEMSQRVQFILITHNKMTMEMATHLCGVTMQEPGVSRLVSVDVDEAAELAAAS